MVTRKDKPTVVLQTSGDGNNGAWMTVPMGPAAGQPKMLAQGSHPVAMMIDGPNTPVKSGTQPIVTPSRASQRNACAGDRIHCSELLS